MRTPVTITTDGALGLTKAIDTMWPKVVTDSLLVSPNAKLPTESPDTSVARGESVARRYARCADAGESGGRRDAIVNQYQRDFPEPCRCLLDDAEASLNHL